MPGAVLLPAAETTGASDALRAQVAAIVMARDLIGETTEQPDDLPGAGDIHRAWSELSALIRECVEAADEDDYVEQGRAQLAEGGTEEPDFDWEPLVTELEARAERDADELGFAWLVPAGKWLLESAAVGAAIKWGPKAGKHLAKYAKRAWRWVRGGERKLHRGILKKKKLAGAGAGAAVATGGVVTIAAARRRAWLKAAALLGGAALLGRRAGQGLASIGSGLLLLALGWAALKTAGSKRST